MQKEAHIDQLHRCNLMLRLTSLYDVIPFCCTFSHTFIEKCRSPFPLFSGAKRVGTFLLLLIKKNCLQKHHIFYLEILDSINLLG